MYCTYTFFLSKLKFYIVENFILTEYKAQNTKMLNCMFGEGTILKVV